MISIVIPCYRSEKTISTVVREIVTQMNRTSEPFEIITVCDCSPDNVWSVIKELAGTYPGIVKGLNLSRNFGQHAAIMAGYRQCRGDVIVTMDDDGQTDPIGIWPLVNKLAEGFDVVYAKYPEHRESAFRRAGSFMDKLMQEMLIGKPKNIKGTSFFAMRRFVLEEMVRYQSAYPYIGGLIYRTTQNIGEVVIEHKDRLEGTSGYNLRRLLRLWINGFTAFSEKPLRVASYLGIICSCFGVFFGIVTIIRKIVNPSIQLGYSSMMSIILFIGGVIMLILGIIGEYVGRIYICMNNAPQYVVREIIVCPPAEEVQSGKQKL